MTKEMIISSSPHETRVAILEDDQVAEVFIERERQRGVVGNLYKGRVSKVLPGMQSSFIDIGLERDGFLYVVKERAIYVIEGDDPDTASVRCVAPARGCRGRRLWISVRDFDAFLSDHNLRVRVLGEFEDSALLKTFARDGLGFVLAPAVLAKDLQQSHDLLPCGALPDLHARWFALTVERRVKHPAFPLLLQAARKGLFRQGEQG